MLSSSGEETEGRTSLRETSTGVTMEAGSITVTQRASVFGKDFLTKLTQQWNGGTASHISLLEECTTDLMIGTFRWKLITPRASLWNGCGVKRTIWMFWEPPRHQKGLETRKTLHKAASVREFARPAQRFSPALLRSYLCSSFSQDWTYKLFITIIFFKQFISFPWKASR